jgi:hypothetical protein
MADRGGEANPAALLEQEAIGLNRILL